jgi:hypothetical protein
MVAFHRHAVHVALPYVGKYIVICCRTLNVS